MIVKKTSVFPASPETVYEKIRKTETLRQIAAPYASFEPAGEESGIWEAGRTSSWRLRLMGVIPLGIHRIQIVRFGPDGISSREGNRHVPVWNHDITLGKWMKAIRNIQTGWRSVQDGRRSLSGSGQTCSMPIDRGNGSDCWRRRKWTTKRNRKPISTGIPELF